MSQSAPRRFAVSRYVDRGAITAAWVGLGMAVTIGVSYLVIPVEAAFLYLALPAGLLIGWYANARSERAGGPWSRILLNAAWAGLITGVTYAALFLGVKALFVNLDSGGRDLSMGGPIACEKGMDCVYQRYLLAEGGPEVLTAAGVTDASSFSNLYWDLQRNSAATTLGLSLGGALAAGAMFGITQRRKPQEPAAGA